ncbi:PREDICTED: uncharacterized protein LOC106899516, partial [Calidris pugnax]|uniref:uncharacterized protein LOC106899516 n=1 Tax=Calidris pugnax TaxID=198806 RepID=UPI00071E02EB
MEQLDPSRARRRQDPAACEQSDFTSDVEMEERKGFSCRNENVEVPLRPQEGGASPHPKVPGATGRRKRVLVVSVLVALVLALAVAVAVLSARTCGGDPAVPVAPVLACPDGWVGYHNVCYYLSRDQGSWEWSQEQCSSRGASLAVLRREWEMRFLSLLKGDTDPWIGLRRRGEHLEWVDGSSFNQTTTIRPAMEQVDPSWARTSQYTAACERSDFTSDVEMEERKGFCCRNENVEVLLSPQDEGASPPPKMPGATGRRTWVLVVAVLVALVLALAVAVAVLSARTRGGDPAVPVAPVLACPDGWVGYHNVCYYLSRDQGSWEWSQEQCSSRGASLAVLRREWEMVSEGLLAAVGSERWGVVGVSVQPVGQ